MTRRNKTEGDQNITLKPSLSTVLFEGNANSSVPLMRRWRLLCRHQGAQEYNDLRCVQRSSDDRRYPRFCSRH